MRKCLLIMVLKVPRPFWNTVLCLRVRSVPAAAEESRSSEDACGRPHPVGRGGPRGPGGVSHPADGGVELGPMRARTAGAWRQCGQVGGHVFTLHCTVSDLLDGMSSLGKELYTWGEKNWQMRFKTNDSLHEDVAKLF